MRFTWVLSFIILLATGACQEKKPSENIREGEAANTSLEASVTNMRRLVSELETALVKISRLNTSDSAKNTLMKRDQDMVAIYKVEEPPLLDTLADDAEVLAKEASSLLDESRALTEAARQQIKQQPLPENDNSNVTQMLSQELKDQIIHVEELISQIENEAKKLEIEVKKSAGS